MFDGTVNIVTIHSNVVAFPVNYFMNIYVVVVFFVRARYLSVRCVRINACHWVRMGACRYLLFIQNMIGRA